jgi:hypothetical protein
MLGGGTGFCDLEVGVFVSVTAFSMIKASRQLP